MSASAFDIGQPAILAHELGEANTRLAKQAETPASVVGLVGELGRRHRDWR